MQPCRTVLAQKIRERRQTLEEFAAYAETFAREHHERATLSVRHLQRLAAGRRSDGRPLRSVQPATARLLERIFDLSIDELLAPPLELKSENHGAVELQRMLHASARVDAATMAVLQDQLSGIRRLDRQLGAAVAHDEVLAKIRQVTSLMTYSLSADIRARLAGYLSELHCLAGWQALDMARVDVSWQQYEQAKAAAVQSGLAPFVALAAAGQAFVLADIEETKKAVEVLDAARRAADRKCSPLLRSWLAAAHGETLAGNGDRSDSLRAFDSAASLLPSGARDVDGPYVALDPVHLARWRGYALARFADPDAVDVLATALVDLDPTFARAETALRVDLATALAALDERTEARAQAAHAGRLAAEIGSTRQQRRMRSLAAAIA